MESNTKKPMSAGKVVLIVILTVLVIGVGSCAACTACVGAGVNQAAKHADQAMGEIQDKVANDAVDQYNISKRQGDKMQACIQAGLVSAAYLQSKNEPKYNEWKAVEKADCKAAGVPR